MHGGIGRLLLGFVLGALVAVAALHLLGTSPQEPAAASPVAAGDTVSAKQLYTCGMHPQIIQDHAGNCPICGMKLTPVRKQPGAATGERRIKSYKSTMMAGEVSPTPAKDSMGMDMVPVYEETAAAESVGTISIDPVTIQNMNLRTGLVTRGPLYRAVRTVGVVDYDETSLADVTTKFKGWIEKLYVDVTGQQVHKGDPLFEIYSPDLYTAQTEYLLALNQAAGGAGTLDFLKASALTKLRFFDISDAQIRTLETTRELKKTLQVLAPRDGIVTEKLVVEGQMVDAGMRLFRIADLGTVWVLAQVYEQDLPFIKLGQEATVNLSYQPDRQYRGRVTYIYPSVDDRTRTARIRTEFHNPGYALKPGMFATVAVETELAKDVLLVPDTAVLRSGETNTVFVALDGGRFAPRTVTLGPRAEGNLYEVLSGLQEGEKVVTSGQFMLDSESQLREAIQKMTAVGAVEPQPVTGGTAPGATVVPKAAESATAPVYICPMPEHVAIVYKHSGACPLCGMTLVPVSPELLAKIQPGETVDYYTCPMPEHVDVHEAKPGKCPKCGMTLVPMMKSIAAAALPATAAAPAPKVAESATTWYVCPMPQDAAVRSDKPGKCPKCGMDLVPEKKK